MPRSFLPLGAVFPLAVVACTGFVEDAGNGGGWAPDPSASTPVGGGRAGTPPSSGPAACTADELPPAPAVRRLTRREYNNTIRDLLGDGSAPARDFGLDGTVGWFENNTSAPVNGLSATQYAEAAESLARAAVAGRLSTLAPCAATGDEACARSFIQSFGKRAFRRPLTEVEQARYLQLYNLGRGDPQAPFASGLRLVIQGLLQSPHFLNHIERGGAAAGPGVVALTPHELAARLSYFIWQSLPDGELFDAADHDRLSTSAQIEAQVTRMLADDKARPGIGSFFQQWLELDRLDKAEKSEALFPLWNATLRSKLRREVETFVAHVFWEGDGKLETLLTAPFSVIDPDLARFYGVPAPAGGADFRKTALDPQQRAGLLTSAGILAAHAYLEGTSPIHRGLFVRNRMLCQVTPPPPDDVEARAPKPDPTHTTRQRLAHHASEPYCRGCHRLMDPIGLGFENYDAIGQYRTSENGQPIDASGEIMDAGDASGTFTGAVELAGKLARASEVRTCLAGQWLAFATGASTGDRPCAVQRLALELGRAGTDLRKLIQALATSDAFRKRPAAIPEVCQ